MKIKNQELKQMLNIAMVNDVNGIIMQTEDGLVLVLPVRLAKNRK